MLVPTRRLTTLQWSTGAVPTRRPAPAPESPRPQVALNLTRPLQITLSARGQPSPVRIQAIGHHCPEEGRPGSTLSMALGSPGGVCGQSCLQPCGSLVTLGPSCTEGPGGEAAGAGGLRVSRGHWRRPRATQPRLRSRGGLSPETAVPFLPHGSRGGGSQRSPPGWLPLQPPKLPGAFGLLDRLRVPSPLTLSMVTSLCPQSRGNASAVTVGGGGTRTRRGQLRPALLGATASCHDAVALGTAPPSRDAGS